MVANIAEVLSKVSPIIGHAPFVEGNQMDGDRVTSRMSLPGVNRRVFNQGVAPTKSVTAQENEGVTILSSQSKADALMAERAPGGVGEFRLSEDRAHLMAQVIQAETCMLYDSKAVDPAQFNGLLTRLSGVAGTPYANQIIRWNTGNTTTNASLLLVGWGPDTVCGIYPRGSVGGLRTQDMGAMMVPDSTAAANLFRAYVTNFDWELGIRVKDPRALAAVRNIDMNLLTPGSLADPVNDLLLDAAAAARKIIPPGTNLQWYCPRALATVLDQMAINATARSVLKFEDIAGRPVTTLHGIPVSISDPMTITEASV